PKIVYVSCNVSTLARDLKVLKDYYRVEKVVPFDLFSQTAHVECVTLMSRVGK
ncbi:MAG: 23S rRNA (uracil(1939)-C(5))-methyltransferase RlmD, partial [Clostridiales bacterium]|nr:23S rRNA (uracil(1939)-C(5))-methyltransferase RlmD [Clostridiales bacterium]